VVIVVYVSTHALQQGWGICGLQAKFLLPQVRAQRSPQNEVP